MADVKKTAWIESSGGPLLLAPRSCLRRWCGATGRGLCSQTDYERACAIESEIGTISIGDRSAIVLGDEPDRTALVTEQSGTSVLIVRWRYAESEESLLSALSADGGLQKLTYSPGGWIATAAEEYVLFDAACSGTQIDRYLSLLLQAGGYSFETTTFKPNENTCAIVHRMRLHLKVV
jgi:hypothetical protein